MTVWVVLASLFLFLELLHNLVMAEILYACAYFACYKTVSVVPKSKCILQGEFKEQERGVKWRVQGKQQVFIGNILHVCPKCKYTY